MDKDRLELMAAELVASGQYKIMRKFVPRENFGELQGERRGSIGVLDFETTGLEPSDKAIELGIIRVEYDKDTCQFGRVLERYSGLEDPGMDIPEHMTELTGIRDEDVRGKRFDDEKVEAIIESCDLLVSHNAKFDRKVGEARFEIMSKKPWGCSMVDVPWVHAGIRSTKLEFIACKLGLFYGAHRAVEDCEVTAEVLSKELLDGKSALWWLLQSARSTWFRVWATDAHIKLKGKLKSNGYEWCDGSTTAQKAWRITTLDVASELEYLRQNILSPGAGVLVEEIGRINRFSERRVRAEMVAL